MLPAFPCSSSARQSPAHTRCTPNPQADFDFAQMQQSMLRLLGKDKLHYWDMIDELILVEEVCVSKCLARLFAFTPRGVRSFLVSQQLFVTCRP